MVNLATLREKRRTNGDEGFTLIELLVVVVIIGILIAIAIPLYLNYKKGANDKSAQSDLRGAISVLEQCNSDNGKYPLDADVPGGGGDLGTTCANQHISASDGTTFTYFTVSSTDQTGYIMSSTNSNGSSKIYCYNSTKGGSVTTTSTAVAASRSAC
jgi:type IV pilus assembly protein PilA